jgi:hypothetical protein
MSHSGGGAPVMGGTGGGVLQCRRRRDRVRRTPLVSHDTGGGSGFRWRGSEATGGRRGQSQWGAWRQRRTERMEKKNGEKGERGRWPVAFEGARVRGAAREKGGGSGVWCTWR